VAIVFKAAVTAFNNTSGGAGNPQTATTAPLLVEDGDTLFIVTSPAGSGTLSGWFSSSCPQNFVVRHAGGSAQSNVVTVENAAAGSCTFTFTNTTGGTLKAAVVCYSGVDSISQFVYTTGNTSSATVDIVSGGNFVVYAGYSTFSTQCPVVTGNERAQVFGGVQQGVAFYDNTAPDPGPVTIVAGCNLPGAVLTNSFTCELIAAFVPPPPPTGWPPPNPWPNCPGSGTTTIFTTIQQIMCQRTEAQFRYKGLDPTHNPQRLAAIAAIYQAAKVLKQLQVDQINAKI
jgi:hypothetical protein